MIFLTGIFLFTITCNRHQPTDANFEKDVKQLGKTASYTIQSIQPELKKLMTFLQLNPQIITPDLLKKAADRHVTISDLGLSDKFANVLPLENGNIFEIYIELFDGSVGNGNTVEDAEVYFTLDVDRYPEITGFTDLGNEFSFPAYVAATSLNRGKGLYKDENSVKQLSISTINKKVDYLWFLVGGEERLSAENEERNRQEMLAKIPGLAKAQESLTTTYVWLTRLKLKEDKDSGTNEEFELYYHGYFYSSSGYAFPASTNFLFNGYNHTDFSGYSRYFSDVNNTNNTYVMLHPIAIAAPFGYGYKIGAIEDDTSAGAHKNEEDFSGFHQHQMNGLLIDIEGGNHSINDDTYTFWIHDDVANDDDIYESSLIVQDIYCQGVGTDEWQVNTGHVTYWLRAGTVWQADNGWQ